MRSSTAEESGRAELASKEEALLNCAEEHSKHITAAGKAICWIVNRLLSGIVRCSVLFALKCMCLHIHPSMTPFTLTPYLQKHSSYASKRARYLVGTVRSSTRPFGPAIEKKGYVLGSFPFGCYGCFCKRVEEA